MNIIKALLLAFSVLFISGCLSSVSIQEEINEARSQAYQVWQKNHEDEKSLETLISGSLSLEDALKLALTNNKELLAIMQEKGIARGRVLSSHAGLLPIVNMVGSYTRLDDNSFNLGKTTGTVNQYSTALQVSQPIFRGGATRAELRSGLLFSCLTNHRVRAQAESTIFDTAKSYYDVLLARHLFLVNEEAVKSAKAHLHDVKLKRAQGAATEYDALRAQVDVSLFEAEMIQQQNYLNLSRTRLLRTMGVSQESKADIAGELIYHPIKPVLTEAIKSAYSRRPDLNQAEIDVRLEREAVRLAVSRFWPQVSAFASQEWANPAPHSPLDEEEWGGNHLAGIQFEWPLFDGLRREGQLIEKKSELVKSELSLLNAQEQAELEVRQSLLSIQDAEEFVESQKDNLKQAQEGLRLVEVGYREGINTDVDVTDARAALTRSKGLYYQATYNHSIARLQLQKAVGLLALNIGEENQDTLLPIDLNEIDDEVMQNRSAMIKSNEGVRNDE